MRAFKSLRLRRANFRYLSLKIEPLWKQLVRASVVFLSQWNWIEPVSCRGRPDQKGDYQRLSTTKQQVVPVPTEPWWGLCQTWLIPTIASWAFFGLETSYGEKKLMWYRESLSRETRERGTCMYSFPGLRNKSNRFLIHQPLLRCSNTIASNIGIHRSCFFCLLEVCLKRK